MPERCFDVVAEGDSHESVELVASTFPTATLIQTRGRSSDGLYHFQVTLPAGIVSIEEIY